MFLRIDGTLLVQIVNFIIFLAVLNVVFMRPVGAAIAKRRAYINGLAADIEQAETDVKSLRGQADAKRAAARREAEELIAKARAEAQNEAAASAGASMERAAEIVSAAHKAVQAELAAARANEDAIVRDLAQTLVSRALGPGAAA
ncbi:MAG: ATP synthase F0 subunit B [Candidatus Velthaea sp.]